MLVPGSVGEPKRSKGKIMDEVYPVLGSAESDADGWNALINAFDEGYDGLERLAGSVFASLDTQPWVEEYREDLIQDGICEVYRSIGTWDRARHPGPWAQVVMRNKMLRKLSTDYRFEIEPIDPHEMEEGLLWSDSGYAAADRADLIERIRLGASEKDREVIDKALNDEPMTKAERQRWRRFLNKFKGE